jgi:hypothetical protein
MSMTLDILKNPLDVIEDMLEASDYAHNRESKTRLHFSCEGKQGGYDIALDWNVEFKAVKLSGIIKATQNIHRDVLDTAVELANETAWNGFFMVDGAGNSLFKTIIEIGDKTPAQTLMSIEDVIDKAISEMDRFCVSLALSDSDLSYQDLFSDDEDWSIDNLNLMFSDIKGNA